MESLNVQQISKFVLQLLNNKQKWQQFLAAKNSTVFPHPHQSSDFALCF
jgi:hypothetical protein